MSIFSGLTIVINGKFSTSQAELKSLITSNGGKVGTSITKSTTHLVTSQDAFDQPSDKVTSAQEAGLSIVSEDFVRDSINQGSLANASNFSFAAPPPSKKSGPKSAKAALAAAAAAAEAEAEAAPAPKKSGRKSAKTALAAAAAAEEPEPEPVKPAKGKGKKAAAAAAPEPEPEPEPAKPAKGKRKATTKAAAAESEVKACEPEDEQPAAKKSKTKKAAATASSATPAAPTPAAPAAASSSSSSSSSGLRGPDKYIPNFDSYTVLGDYNIELGQTNIGGGQNNNKYYIIQVVQRFGGSYMWTRWGRQGEPGQNSLDGPQSEAAAISGFCKKFKEKTKNDWHKRAHFVKYDQKYQIVEKETDDKLTKAQINKAQAVLGQLRQIVEGQRKAKPGEIAELSSQYYSFIPTITGRSVPPPINTVEMITEKEGTLEFWLRMGFEDMSDNSGTGPIHGLLSRPVPPTLSAAAKSITDPYSISSAEGRAAPMVATQVGKPTKHMSLPMYASILLYTGNSIYRDLNAVLRAEDRAKAARYFDYLRLFFAAMDCMPKATQSYWRGISVDLYDQYAEGKEIIWWSVSSLTSDENVARNFMRSCGGNCTLIILKAKSAMDISCMSFYPNEKESLLAPGTKLKVISRKRVGNVSEVRMEEIGSALE